MGFLLQGILCLFFVSTDPLKRGMKLDPAAKPHGQRTCGLAQRGQDLLGYGIQWSGGIVFLTVISGYLQTLTGDYVSKFVWALILGVFASAFGLIDRNVLIRSRSMGFVYTIIMMMVFAGLSSYTTETVVQLIKNFAILIILAVFFR